jgi:hypothetical protein
MTGPAGLSALASRGGWASATACGSEVTLAILETVLIAITIVVIRADVRARCFELPAVGKRHVIRKVLGSIGQRGRAATSRQAVAAARIVFQP